MAERDVDAYLAGLDPTQREPLQQLRAHILEAVPDAEQGLAYGLPAFRLAEGTVAGFGAFRHHLAYLPHSGSVLTTLQDELRGYRTTKGSLHFTAEAPLPRELVHRLVATRTAELHRG